MTRPRIWTLIPWCPSDIGTPPGRDLGRAYNDYMALVPSGDWGLILDHDATFLTDTWPDLLDQAVEQNPDAGMIVAKTTRLKPWCSGWQMAGPGNIHDMPTLRQFAASLERTWGATVRNVTMKIDRDGGEESAGFFMCIPKHVWSEIGDVSAGFDMKDREVHRRVKSTGRQVLMLEGVLLYHWFRGKKIHYTKRRISR